MRIQRFRSVSVYALSVILTTLLLAGCNSPDTGGFCDAGTASLEKSTTVSGSSFQKIQLARNYTRFLVRMKPGLTNSLGAKALQRELSKEVSLENVRDGLFVAKFKDTADAERYVSELRNSPDVVRVEPNYRIHINFSPNDKNLSLQWAHRAVSSFQAWDLGQGGDLIVAVTDTGIDYTHPDLAANAYVNSGEIPGNGIDDDGDGFIDNVYGYNFVKNNGNPMDDNLHGSHVSGIIGGVTDNGIGMAGHAPKVKIMALKFLDDSGSGDTSDAIRAIDYAIARKVSIINASWGGGDFSQELQDAIQRAQNAGILFVVAAGNDSTNNDSKPSYPSSYPNEGLLSVASTNCREALSSFSNYGATSVDVGSPGENIYSTLPNNKYGYLSGTSMATPAVVGIAALIRGARPNLSPVEVKSLILSTADPLTALSGKVLTGGRVNAFKALKAATAKPAFQGFKAP